MGPLPAQSLLAAQRLEGARAPAGGSWAEKGKQKPQDQVGLRGSWILVLID